MSTTYVTQGIVLKRRDHREYDRVYTLYTEEYGKIDAVARGVRKITSKLAGHLEPMSFSNFMLAVGRSFDVLATSVKQSSFRIPQQDVVGFALASYFFEAVDRLTRYRQHDPGLFHLLRLFLHEFENGVRHHDGPPVFQRVLVTEYFLFHLLVQLGYKPMVTHCTTGREPLPAGAPVGSSPRQGGLVCAQHRSDDDQWQEIDPQTLALLQLMAEEQLEAIRFMNRRMPSLLTLASVMSNFLTYHCDEPLQSRAFLNHILRQSS